MRTSYILLLLLLFVVLSRGSRFGPSLYEGVCGDQDPTGLVGKQLRLIDHAERYTDEVLLESLIANYRDLEDARGLFSIENARYESDGTEIYSLGYNRKTKTKYEIYLRHSYESITGYQIDNISRCYKHCVID
ncbi:hypothetical protein B9Z55_006962 [Caenorhabditis nigoni]|uniref:Uncharacterized protein n=1 Tax=Caenorhabditis nigoni TaxID=1611254 RepID=A0A2G5V7G8_9PELO|nr:hypothetical protein B9Z55_006962 [Caenorhabditis nigoni]